MNVHRTVPAKLVHLLVKHAAEPFARDDLPIVQLHLVVQPLPHLHMHTPSPLYPCI